MQESISPPKEASIAEHVSAGRVQGPVVTLASRADLPGDLDEAVIQTEVVPDGVLPRRPPLAVVRKVFDDVLADVTQCQHIAWGLRDGHGNQRNVRIGRLGVLGVGAGLLPSSFLLLRLTAVVRVNAASILFPDGRFIRATAHGLGLALSVRFSHRRRTSRCRGRWGRSAATNSENNTGSRRSASLQVLSAAG